MIMRVILVYVLEINTEFFLNLLYKYLIIFLIELGT